MSGDPWAGPLLLQLVLIFLSACYAAAEVALLSLNATKLHHDAEEGDPTAAKLLRITDAPARTPRPIPKVPALLPQNPGRTS